MRRVPVLQEQQDQPLHLSARHPGQGRDARWHHALFVQRPAALPLHGLLHLQRIHRGGRGLASQDQSAGQPRTRLSAGLRRHHRHRRRAQHGQGSGRRLGGRLRAGRHRPGRHPGCTAGQGRAHHRHRHQPRQVPAGPAVRRHRLPEPEGPRQAHPAGAHRDDRLGRGPHLRVHRQRQRHACRTGSGPPRLGPVGDHRRGRRGTGNLHPPLPAGRPTERAENPDRPAKRAPLSEA